MQLDLLFIDKYRIFQNYKVFSYTVSMSSKKSPHGPHIEQIKKKRQIKKRKPFIYDRKPDHIYE